MRFFILVFLIIAASCGVSDKKKDATKDSSIESVESDSNVKIETLVLDVEGMTCTGCEQTVEKTVLALPGVKAVDASHTQKKATIEFVEGKLEKEKVVKAIKGAGYKVIE